MLVSRQAPGGDLGSFQEGGGDMVIAIFTDHFLGQVRLADLDILAVARSNHLHGVTVGFHRHFKAELFQDGQNFLGGHGNAQNGVDGADAGGEVLAFTRSTGRAVKLGGGHFAAAQLLDQVQGAGHAQLGGIFADALLVMGGSIRVLAKAAGGLADVITGKLG